MPSVVMHTKVILDGGPNRTKFFYQIESDSEGEFSDSTRFEIAVTDGVHLWKGIGGRLGSSKRSDSAIDLQFQ